ncbi:hypothetical protein ACHAO8_009016 [Botrytis cinerea]
MRRFYNYTSPVKWSRSSQQPHQGSHLRASLLTLRSFTVDADSKSPTKNNFEQDYLLKYQGRIPLPRKKFERVPAGQGLLFEMLPDTSKMISKKLLLEKWDKHVDKHSGESYITNNSEPFDGQSERLFKLEEEFRREQQKSTEAQAEFKREQQKSTEAQAEFKREQQKSTEAQAEFKREQQKSAEMKRAWDKERQEINMGEFIRAKIYLVRLSHENNTKVRIDLSPLEKRLAEERNRNAHRLDLSISIKQVTQHKCLNLGLIFQALYGISQEEVKSLLEMDKQCGGMFQVESIVGYHGTLYARKIPSGFLQPFKQWLEAVRKVKSQIDDTIRLDACQEDTVTACSALISRVDDTLLQEVGRLGQICKERYEGDNNQSGIRTHGHDESIMEDLKERGLLSKFRAI